MSNLLFIIKRSISRTKENDEFENCCLLCFIDAFPSFKIIIVSYIIELLNLLGGLGKEKEKMCEDNVL